MLQTTTLPLTLSRRLYGISDPQAAALVVAETLCELPSIGGCVVFGGPAGTPLRLLASVGQAPVIPADETFAQSRSEQPCPIPGGTVIRVPSDGSWQGMIAITPTQQSPSAPSAPSADNYALTTAAALLGLAWQSAHTIAERTRELSALLAISQTTTSTLDIASLFELILQQLQMLIPHQGAYLYQGGAESLQAIASCGGLPDLPAAAIAVCLDDPQLRRILYDAPDTLIIDDVWGDAPAARSWRAGVDAAAQAVLRDRHAWMWVPLMIRDRLVGVLSLTHRSSGAFQPHHAELARTFANHAAVALENARLYREARDLAAIEERQRLARDLHDSVTQILFSANLIADVLPRRYTRDPQQGTEALADLRRLVRGAQAEMRALLLELRPKSLEEGYLSEYLRQLADATMARAPLQVDLRIEGRANTLPPAVTIAFYRIAQEALNNAVKHAAAKHIDLLLSFAAESVTCIISDNGRGFAMGKHVPGHYGLAIMAERAAAAGIDLKVESTPDVGTTVTIRWN